ncbi:hypothetical protein KIPB_012159, partial [Kipferlia bialata]|eukprot:g12159.t1
MTPQTEAHERVYNALIRSKCHEDASFAAYVLYASLFPD